MTHPDPLATPAGYQAVVDARGLVFAWRSAWGERSLLGTEPVRIVVRNGGYPLRDVVLEIRAADSSGKNVYHATHEVAQLPRGVDVAIDIPSYDIAEPVQQFSVRLASAAFDWSPQSDAIGKG